MEWDEFSEEIQNALYDEGFLDMADNWIDDVCDVYDYMVNKDIGIFLFERNYEYIEYLYKLKYWAVPNRSVLENFYFSEEYKEVEKNHEYYKKNMVKFKHGTLRSHGEKYLYNILLKRKVKFVFGESDGCKNDKTQRPLLFDFIIYHKGKKIYVEIQGGQHYSYNPYFFKDYDDFEERLYKDSVKRKFAEENGIFISLDYLNSDLDYLDKEIKEKLLPLIK